MFPTYLSLPLPPLDSSAAIRQIESAQETTAATLSFSSKSVTRRGGGSDEVEGVKNVQGSFLEGFFVFCFLFFVFCFLFFVFCFLFFVFCFLFVLCFVLH